jgi:hypothetical protein
LGKNLTSILVAGSGRSGTTMLMELLGTDPDVAFDRVYPFENRYLSYFAKFAVLSGRRGRGEEPDGTRFSAFDTDVIGAPPWPTDPPAGTPFLAPAPADLLRGMWAVFSQHAAAAMHYAEKARAWLPAFAREAIPCWKVDLVRDPRDIYLSANAFNQKRGFLAFGRGPKDSDRDYARRLAAALLLYFENQWADRHRSDSLTVRYEDLVSARRATVDRLNAQMGLHMAADAAGGGEHLPIHMTSADVLTSVERWKREPVPPDARVFLETHLAEAMRFNGYEVPRDTPAPNHINLHELARCSKDGTATAAEDGSLCVTIHGDDFWIEFQTPEFDAARVCEVWLCVRGNIGQQCSLYWRRARENFDERRSVHWPFAPGEHWQVVRFHPAGHPHWHGRIVQLRVDLFNGQNVHGSGEVRWLRLVD